MMASSDPGVKSGEGGGLFARTALDAIIHPSAHYCWLEKLREGDMGRFSEELCCANNPLVNQPMSIKKFIRELFSFKVLFIASFRLDSSAKGQKQLCLDVKPYKNGACCPECGRRGKIIPSSTLQSRRWRDITCAGRVVWLHYRPREILCPTHGRSQEVIPWAAGHSRFTFRFEYLMLRLCSMMPQARVADILKVPPSTLADVLHRVVERYRKGHQIQGVTKIGIDEISYKKGHKYLTLVYDLDDHCVIWAGKGKARETIDRFFNEVLDVERRDAITVATCDMSETFIGAIEEFCPNAEVVLDRFHVVQALNQGLDEVRKEQWRAASADERKALKGLRWLLFKHPDHRTKRDTRILNQLRKANKRIHRAWVLKDEFQHFWEFNSRTCAGRFLMKWTRSALLSRLEPLRKFAHTVRRHMHRILTFVDTRASNAVAESINRRVRQIRNWASGFTNLRHFINLIFLRMGDLDIPAQIAAPFRIW